MIIKVFYTNEDDPHVVYSDLFFFNSAYEMLEHFGPNNVIYAVEVVGKEEIKDFNWKYKP